MAIAIGEVLRTVNFNRDFGFVAQKVDFHFAFGVEWNGHANVQSETACGLGQRFQTVKEKRFGGAPSEASIGNLSGNRPNRTDKQIGQRRIHSVLNQTAHAGGVVAFPFWIDRQRHIGWPSGNGAGGNLNRIPDGFVALAASVKHF